MASTLIWETLLTQKVCEINTILSAQTIVYGRRHGPSTKTGIEKLNISEDKI